MASGTADKVKGAAKEVVGKVTGNKKTKTEGKADQIKGAAKKSAEKVTKSAKGMKDSVRKK